MVIQCPECQTRFKLADEKIKPEGIKVRCSRCRYIFSVQPPAAEPDPTPAPAAAEPAPREEEFDFGSFNMESVPAAGNTSPAETDSDGGTAAATPDHASQEETAEDGGFSFPEPSTDAPVPTFSFGEEAAGEETFAPSAFAFDEKECAEPADGGEEEEFVFGDLPAGDAESDGFSFQPARPEDFTSEEETSPSPTDFAFDESESAWSTPAPEEKTAADFDFTPAEPAGDNEEFDFSNISFGEESTEPPLPTGISVDGPEIRPQPATISTAPTSLDENPAPAPEPSAPPLPLPARKRRRRKSPISGVFVFVVLLLLALSAAAYIFWQGGIPDLTSRFPELKPLIARITGDVPPPAVAGEIRLTDLNGSFVNNNEAGQLFVIQGRATNAFPEARSAIAVKGVLYNKAGKLLLQQTVFSGNPLNEEALRSLPFAKIEEKMNNQFGDSLSNLNVGPGKAIPFTIVFKNLPSDLAEFTVEVTDSKPGAG